MKEMKYTCDLETKEILYEGEYKGYYFYIVSYGIHPCAYIEIPKNHRWFGRDYNDEELENIECHGGLTYSDNLHHVLGKEKANGRWFIGWDYGHLGDFEGFYLDDRFEYGVLKNDKKWTTEEIYKEVCDVIDQIVAYEGRKEEK